MIFLYFWIGYRENKKYASSILVAAAASPGRFYFRKDGGMGNAPAWDFSIEKLGKTLDNGPGIVYYIACPLSAAPWSSGLRHRPFTAVTGVRVS